MQTHNGFRNKPILTANQLRKNKFKARKRLFMRPIVLPWIKNNNKNIEYALNMHTSLHPLFYVWVYGFNFALFLIPIMILSVPYIIMPFAIKYVMNAPLVIPYDLYVAIGIIMIIFLLFAKLRINKHMRYYRLEMTLNKMDINLITWNAIAGTEYYTELEIANLDKLRMRYNDLILFPSKKIVAVRVNEYNYKIVRTGYEGAQIHAANHESYLSKSYILREHKAAKRIAEWKHKQKGGTGLNEYEKLVKKYLSTTDKEFRYDIEKMQ